ncbi:hypothetical protein AB0883_18125 [Micromonospora sp. NPDC047812]|uniref:hypothetical protein n=1 Tax=Micromonospora sp. NPDC047812 TaxID=3155742 RepID=UPI003456AC82
MLACDLLVAGVNRDAVVALAAESAPTLPAHDANRRLAAVTAELGLPVPDLPTAVALIAADTCERILDGSIPAEVGTHRLYVVGHEGSRWTTCSRRSPPWPSVSKTTWAGGPTTTCEFGLPRWLGPS